jgi:YgiT-type zinc finger domain-containing protein
VENIGLLQPMRSNKKQKRNAGGDACEYCDGKVREHVVEREIFRDKSSWVILEHVPIGICDKCGERYYSAEILRKVHNIAIERTKPARRVTVPTAKYA